MYFQIQNEFLINNRFGYGHLTNSFACRFLKKFLFCNQLNLLMFKKLILVRDWMKAALDLILRQRVISLDMRDIHLQINVGLQNGRLFNDFMKQDELGKTDMGISFTDDELQYVTHANNIFQCLFSNVNCIWTINKRTTRMVSMDRRL